MEKKYDVFISYRREGGYDTAKHLYDLLTRDGYRVTFDIDTLRAGDFDTQLFQRIDQCKDFILIVDQHAFDRTLDTDFDPKKDWMRCELAYALKQNKNIIPVFLSGVTGFPEGLPDDIIEVTKKNGPEYNRYYFNDFYKTLKAKFLHKKKKNYTLIILLGAIIIAGLALTIHFIQNKHNEDCQTITNNQGSSTVNEDKLDVLYIINDYIRQSKENGCSYWNMFSNNELLTQRDLGVESADDNCPFSNKLDYIAKLRFNGSALMKDEAGQDAISIITLMGYKIGPVVMKIELMSGGDRTIIETANNIAQKGGFKHITDKKNDAYCIETSLYEKDGYYFLIYSNCGSAGYFVTLYLIENENDIEYFNNVDL
jgi:hypothetical protein